MDLLAWLKTLTEYPKIYWKDRETGLATAAVGVDSVSDVLFGWRMFRKTTAPHWADFASENRFSPRLVFTSSALSELKDPTSISPLTERFLPDYPMWGQLLQKTLSQIQKSDFEKCVLAREHQLTFADPIDPWPLVAALEKRVKNAYLICIQPTARSVFITATPEKLFSRKGNLLETEALASTKTLDADLMFQKEKNSKDQREFRLVEDSIREALLPLCEEKLSFSEQKIRQTSHLKHLYSHLKVLLRANISDEELLDRLHPTAALLGLPKQKVFQFLEENEIFDRGLYGAPIGRITPQESTWAVGIRSCLIFESTVRLYSGAGIVEGSHFESEWEELNQKLHNFRDFFICNSKPSKR
ncbi:MAG: isochorismate synthase [Chlamydiae bacterium]|nr:isochorismate synthase [Chlamydiota bacterium]